MPFPIATGGKQVSSTRIKPPTLPEEYGGNNATNVAEDGGVAVASYNDTLSATLAVSYYPLENNSTVACLRIQIAPLADSFSGQFRESIFHIILPTKEAFDKSQLKAIFVHKHIACIIGSRVVILQLRKPLPSKRNPTEQLPTLPPYIINGGRSGPMEKKSPVPAKSAHYFGRDLARDKDADIVIPVASRPRLVPQLEGVTALCDMQTSTNAQNSILLAGLSDGRIVAISYRDVIAAGTLWRLELQEKVLSLRHISMGKRGRLAAIQNGKLSILESHSLIGTEEETSGIVSDGVAAEADEDDLYRDESEGLSQRSTQLDMSGEPSDLIRMSLRQTSVVLVNLSLTHSLVHEKENETFLSSEWIDSYHIALLFCPKSVTGPGTNHTIAAVFSLELDPPTLKLVSSFTTAPQKLTEVAKGRFLIDPMATGCAANMNYHAQSSCLFISSYFAETETSILPFACCWHWPSNTTSLVLVGRFSALNGLSTPYFSHLSSGQGLQKGSRRIVHIVVSSGRFQKILYTSSSLSPPSSRSKTNNLQFEQPLVLADSSITFPTCHTVSNLPRDFEVEWRTATIPSSYIVACGGPPIMACIAPKKCHSIAVASPLGLCVFDTARSNKWKRFDKAEETQFSVLIMKWWEDEDEEDILVCIIELRETRQRFLAGWSRKRLDLSCQLLEPIDDPSISRSLWGIPLPPNFSPDSISILSATLINESDDILKESYSTRKAVVLVTDTDNAQEPSLIIFQLQTVLISDKRAEIKKDSRLMKVKCSLALHGGLSPDHKNIFLANASFRFDLTQRYHDYHQTLKKGGKGQTESILPDENNSIVAIIGMITPQDGVKVAIATKAALLSETAVLRGSVSRVILCNALRGYYYWTLELTSDRSLWCWAVPPAEYSNSKPELSSIATDNPSLLHLKPPCHLVSSNHDNIETFWFGTLSCVGNSEMWMLGSTNITRSQFPVGCIPSSAYGCVMYLGQDGSSDSHEIISESQSDGLTSVLMHESFRVGEVSISTPLFLFPLIHHLLTEQPSSKNRSDFDAWTKTQNAFLDSLISASRIDTSFTALRLLVLRSVETVASVAKTKEKDVKRSNKQENEDQYRLAREFFIRVIALLNDILTPTFFASLLLSVARQLEPSCMKHLFPLPREASAMLTIEDLYLQAVEHGSLATSSSSLPLLSTKVSALEECKDILYHCLWKLTSSSESVTEFDGTREERHLVRDLFRFATQLELMTDAEFWSDDVKLNATSIPTAEEKKKIEKAANGRNPQADIILTPTKVKRQSTLGVIFNPLFCSRSTTPLICIGSSKKNRKKKLVYEATGAFVGSGFEEIDYDTLEQNTSMSERGAKVSVLFLTGKILIRLCVEDGEGGWTRAANLSRLVLGDNAIDESGEGILEWFQRLSLQSLAVAAYKLLNSADDLNLTNPDEMTNVATSFIIQGIHAAQKEKLSTCNGAWLLELVILSLSRLSLADSINVTSHVAPSLILIATIIGHTTGRMEDMVRGWKNRDPINPIWTCYELAKKQLLTV
mmetsp:Transcript_20400/g.30272  ORF Transcript_20400/g.30272 Transcript_20400/m.30272 type:complete len:1520 (+) Transcript_20400:178-4737(+)|eukprot:CAMPEP_0194258640 /NCGR_PEP_ID=MMETSP0158-20130606/41703_1 /TAXON_ID=33649 /ORGANISM="Thalassionema nitzschioides, Strain L26-B" /LENGTH=1519 /DNA_ID=CAMNT_0038998117 /DNA_START=95 /DNA_END=4654 /DNA_ORIENTATION=+